ncbi:MAG: methyltransferase domain-containing protein [Acidimicrobiales bacterium]
MGELRSYADFGLMRSWRQVVNAVTTDHAAGLAPLKVGLERDVDRLETQLGEQLTGLRLLEIGPGQGLERAHYLGLSNTVEALDLDVVSARDAAGWWRMARTNGAGRVVKSLGRELLVNRSARRSWIDLVGGTSFIRPRSHQGDIVDWRPAHGAFDAVVSWSVFEHVSDPRAALAGVIEALRPGGAALISIHNYTSANGHHDIRSFTGVDDQRLLWGHLRPSTAAGIRPSAFLNEWRLADWRRLFDELTPGYVEYLDQYEHPEVFGPLIDGAFAEELDGYSRDELLTVNAVFVFRKAD